MAEAGTPVDIDEVRLDGLLATDLKNRCAKIRAALDAGGSATVSFRGQGGGHTMQVVDIECKKPDDDDVTITLTDPNEPDGAQFEIVIDRDDRVESLSVGHVWLEPGAKMFRVMIETPKD